MNNVSEISCLPGCQETVIHPAGKRGL